MIAIIHENGIGDLVGFSWPGYPYNEFTALMGGNRIIRGVTLRFSAAPT
jgi:hypothetical protein